LRLLTLSGPEIIVPNHSPPGTGHLLLPLKLLHAVLRFAVSGCTTPSPCESQASKQALAESLQAPPFSLPPAFSPPPLSHQQAQPRRPRPDNTGQDPSQTQGLSNTKRNAHPFSIILPSLPPSCLSDCLPCPPSTRSTAREIARPRLERQRGPVGRSVNQSVSQSRSAVAALTSFSCAFPCRTCCRSCCCSASLPA
jgi:hypothetical protein